MYLSGNVERVKEVVCKAGWQGNGYITRAVTFPRDSCSLLFAACGFEQVHDTVHECRYATIFGCFDNARSMPAALQLNFLSCQANISSTRQPGVQFPSAKLISSSVFTTLPASSTQ